MVGFYVVTLGGGARDEELRAATRAEIKNGVEKTEKYEDAGEDPIKNIGVINSGDTKRNVENDVK